MRLLRADCEEYFRLHAEAALAKTRMDELKPALLAALKEGCSSPNDLPYRLQLRLATRAMADYKTPLLAALKRLLGTAAKAETRLAEIETGFESKEVESLHVVINQAYAAE